MNYYQELIELLRNGEYIVFKAGGTKQRQVTKYGQIVVDIIEQLVRERDAAIADLKEYASCDYCKHSNAECKEYWNIGECGLHGLCGGEKFEWRGVQE